MTIAEFYRSEWGGIFDGTDEELDILLNHAEIVVDEAVMMSGVTVSAAPEKLRDRLYMAVCAQVDSIEAAGGVYALSESGSGGSVTLGKFSYSGGGVESSSGACELCAHAQTILRPTGLLYKGVGVH